MILSGELPPGSDHLETELAAKLGLSRTPVREAALILQALGLLEVRPRKGVRIATISAKDLDEIYDILAELEGLAARRVAEARATDADIVDLTSAICRMEATVDAENREPWAEADRAFHATIVRLCRNPRLSRVVEALNDQIHRARAITLHLRPAPHESNAEHRQILDAIIAGDGGAAQSLVHAHRRRAGKLVSSLLERAGLKRL